MVRHIVMVEVESSVPESELDKAAILTVGPNTYSGVIKGIQSFPDPLVPFHTHSVTGTVTGTAEGPK